MALGDNPFTAIAFGLDMLLNLHGVSVDVSRNDPDSPLDRYGKPKNSAQTFTATVLIGKQFLDEVDTIAGGKTKETLILIGRFNTLRENDVVTYDSHQYTVDNVAKTVMQSVIAAEVYTAMREVDVQ